MAAVALSAHFLVPVHSRITKSGQEPQSEQDSAMKSSTAADDLKQLHLFTTWYPAMPANDIQPAPLAAAA